jgi:hypothetical protein
MHSSVDIEHIKIAGFHLLLMCEFAEYPIRFKFVTSCMESSLASYAPFARYANYRCSEERQAQQLPVQANNIR